LSDSKNDPPGSVLGIDYGSRRVGVAVSDPMRILAQGAGALINDAHLLARLMQIIHDRGITLVVVGMPYSDDGGKGQQAREVDRFIDRLRDHIIVDVDTWDESLTSREAQRILIRAGTKKKQRRQKERVDEMAACLLLQEYLDHRKELERRN
jgi:putative Holliday junction resolvase